MFAQSWRCLMWQSGKVALWQLPTSHLDRYRRKVIHDGRKLRIRGLDVTVRLKAAIKRVQSHAGMSYAEREQARCWKHQFDDFVLKIAPNRRPKFGSARKMLYLCIVNQKTGAHSKWETRKRDSATRCSWPKLSLIPWKTRLSESRPSSLEVCRAWVFSLVKQKHI